MDTNNAGDIIRDLEGLPIRRNYNVWKSFMEKYKCDSICEVGVEKGEHFNLLIQHNPSIAVAVDIWKDDGVISRSDDAFTQEELDRQYDDFRKRMADKPFVRIYREYSFEAVKRFPDGYFDFVYIDADHSYEGCLRDIGDWYPKVKKGKVLVGDDYRIARTKLGVDFGVREAVNAFAKEKALDFYLIPRYKWVIIRK